MAVSDEAIIYQLEKVDQGGEVQDLFYDRMKYLAEAWGYEFVEDEHIVLPDGRIATLEFQAVIREPS